MTLSTGNAPTTVPEHGLLSLSAAAWKEAKRRALVIAPLAGLVVVPTATAAGNPLEAGIGQLLQVLCAIERTIGHQVGGVIGRA